MHRHSCRRRSSCSGVALRAGFALTKKSKTKFVKPGKGQCINQILAARLRHCYYHGSTPSKSQGDSLVDLRTGKKDLEKQWENFFVHQRSGSRLFSCESVWARAGEGEWLRVGAVVTKSDDVSNADAVAAQKKLISWSATQLFPALNAKKGQAPELGLGPYVDDEKDDDGDASKVAPVGKGDKAAPLSDVGFKPIRSPLDEHRAGLGATLLNKSVGKGSAKFKGAAAASAAPGAAADSKGVL